MENEFKILGFTCGSCVNLAQKRIIKLDGVNEVKISLDGKTVVLSDRLISVDEIQNALKDTHYTVSEQGE